jgi:dTDP-4-dehydrorhamnose 3,5-epimerase
MIFTETELHGAYILDLERREDQRGFFARTWDIDELGERGLDTRIVQASVSFNARKGTLRGMHMQGPPHEEVKVVRATRGSVLDVIVDLRPESPTYRRWTGVELTARNGRALYVPKGFAHGFQTLEDDTETLYLISDFYAPEAERGLRWNDPAFRIEWPDPEHVILSEKDASWPDWSE